MEQSAFEPGCSCAAIIFRLHDRIGGFMTAAPWADREAAASHFDFVALALFAFCQPLAS